MGKKVAKDEEMEGKLEKQKMKEEEKRRQRRKRRKRRGSGGGQGEAFSLRIISSCATRGPEGGGGGLVMTDTMNRGVNEPNKC